MKIVLAFAMTIILCGCLFSGFSARCSEEDRARELSLVDLNALGVVRVYPLCSSSRMPTEMPRRGKASNARVFDVLGSPSIVALYAVHGFPSIVELVNLANAKSIKRMRMPVMTGLDDMRISPDLGWAAAAGWRNDSVHPIQRGVYAWREGERRERVLLTVSSNDEIPSTVSWSPDSKSLLVSYKGMLTKIFVANGAQEVIGPGTCPRWSPDGTWIAYLTADEELALLRTQDGTIRSPLPGKKLIGPHLEWTPDSAFLSVNAVWSSLQDSPTRSDLGVLEVKTGRYRPMGPSVWGRNPLFRWVEGGEIDLIRLSTIVARDQETWER